MSENNEKIYTVKHGLNKFIKGLNKQLILNRIEQDVIEMSNLAFEASRLIYFSIYSKLITKGFNNDFSTFNFLDYFYQLKIGSPSKYELSQQYESMRNGLPKYDGSSKSNLFIDLANGYKTVFHNNIWMHAYPRVRKLIKRLNPEASNSEIYTNLSYLFDQTSQHEKSLNFHFNWSKAYFHNVKQNPMSFVCDFFKIQQLNDMKEWKNFTLVPLYKAGRKHIQYDRRAFHALLCALKIVPKKLNEKGRMVQVTDREFDWNEFINVRQLPKANFHGSFTTDGVSVCVKYNRVFKPKHPSKEIINNFNCEIGMDPGLKLFITAVKKYPQSGYHENVKISNATYQYENGSHSRKNKRLKWTKKQDELIEKDRNGVVSSMSPTKYKEFVRFELKWMKKKQLMYNQKKIARLKFDEYVRKHKTVSNYVNLLVGKAKKVGVYYGDASIAANSPIKGYVRIPGKLLKEKLKLHPRITVIMVDEFRSSKLCSLCYQEVQIPKSPHRFVSCQSCKKVFNRDINAANNMLTLGRLEELKRPIEFCRTTRS
ncbi:MAG: zinc ribbon domain-containing protein [Cetobacterium sp.]